MKPRIIFYYQTFTSLEPILYEGTPVTHIHLSSIHFGVNDDSSPYIHLNDTSPYDNKFNMVWGELERAVELGIKVHLMIGGAGGGYSTLYSKFPIYYDLLRKLIENKKEIISGIDLDIEEYCSLKNVKLLIRTLKENFANTINISMAPIQSSLEFDESGLGGFVYKRLLQSQEGKMINYFNGQFYGDFSLESYEQVIQNGYLPEMVVMGATAGNTNLEEISKIYDKYGDKFGGVFVWEYCFAKPNPQSWLINIATIFNKNNYDCNII